jgi:hypothetical protein
LIKLRGDKFKSYAEKFAPQAVFARQHLHNLKANIGAFIGRDFHMKAGMKNLIESFYNSIVQGKPVPIPYSEILRTARIMDSIFEQLDAQRARTGTVRLEEPEHISTGSR